MSNANTRADNSSPLMMPVLVVLNLVPLVGVFAWGWQSFDLIFLYWLENVVIGLFTVGRMVARPYGHAVELAFPLFFAPFFAVHYGGFCWGHGTFIVSLFGADELGRAGVIPAALQVLQSPQMLLALAALVAVQLLDWLRDIRANGVGSDSLMVLMTKPYRRIIVLHLTIIGSGFALSALHEPVAGLVLLVVLKTAFDLWHWRKDAQADELIGVDVLTDEKIAQFERDYPEPVVKVNGKEVKFDSFRDMKASKEFRLAMSLMQLIGAGKDLKALNRYMDLRIERESATASA